MKFYSTRGNAPEVDFKTALFQGIAPDGGLYMPQNIPLVHLEELNNVATLQEVGYLILRKWIASKDIPDKALKNIVDTSFTFPIPLVSVGNYSILELFHGPTMAFKDIAARVLARMFAYYLEKEKKTITIMVATSGDTGGAIAQAFSSVQQVKVVILYPKGKVSELQEDQLTRVEGNVLSIAINGNFDDCQQIVKQAFKDNDLQELNLSSANSINIGRLLPQIIYYAWAYRQLRQEKIRFAIPSGNMGSATAALFASRMGIPISSLIIATNENDSAVRYYQTGIYRPKKTMQTLSTAMDIGNPNNFERVLELFHHDHEAFCKMITAVKVTDAETIITIKKVYQQMQYLMDFHTAVGYSASEKIADSSIPTVVISTASPEKFAKEMNEQTGISVDNSQILKHLRAKKKNVISMENDYDAVKKILVSRYQE